MEKKLGIIVLDNMKEMGKKLNKELNKIRNDSNNYLIQIKLDRFTNGEAKATILDTVRDKDIYILSDIGNYSLTYKMHGFENHYSPDDHFQDIKRVILAMCGHAKKITLIAPLLYESRQHRRKGRESLDCSHAISELASMGVKEIITFDVHDPNVCNAAPLLAFENIYPTNLMLKDLIDNNKGVINNLIVISPDFGAMERARYFAELLKCDVGVFYKRRDLTKVIDGKNPIVEHAYMGAELSGKNIIIVDDMIASGLSMLEVASAVKKKGANKVFICTTFSLFTEGIEKFEEAYKNNIFNEVYTTNLTYIKEELKNKKWFKITDCSKKIAEAIDALNKEESIEKVLSDKENFKKVINKMESAT